jgi:putative heme-binding domain-containing protein
VNNTGGHLGPDLSRVGAARSREIMQLRIRRGLEEFRAGFEPVTLTPQTGQPIHGVKKNEDLFSVQIMDTRERIQGYEKDKMKSVQNDTKSAMPIFGPDRLSDSDLDDLLRYLQTLTRIRSRGSSHKESYADHDRPSRPDCAVAPRRYRCVAATAGASAATRHVAGDLRRPAGRRLALADLRRQLQQPAAQPAHADHARQRESPGAAVDVPDGYARQFRNDVTPA